MNAMRSSAVNSVFCLADRVVDDADDDLVEHLRGAADDVEVAVGDRVVGARADGDAALVGAHRAVPVDRGSRVSP